MKTWQTQDINNTNDPQKKYCLRTVSKNILREGPKGSHGANPTPSSDVDQGTQMFGLLLFQNRTFQRFLGGFYKMGCDVRKPVFRVSDIERLKPASCSATKTSKKIEISLISSMDMILYNTGITKTLIRLRVCAGWSALLLFANHQRQVFSWQGPNKVTKCGQNI